MIYDFRILTEDLRFKLLKLVLPKLNYMGFSFSKLFNTKTSKTPLKSNDSIEAIISDVENTPFGISQNNVLYAGLNELGGYYFFPNSYSRCHAFKNAQRGTTITQWKRIWP